MAEPFLGQISIFGFNFAPRGFALCDGQILPINQNQSLYSLLGTMYGGDGRTTFGLPDLRGRSQLHTGQGLVQGHKGGAEAVTLSIAEMPSHTHRIEARASDADAPVPGNNFLARTTAGDIYRDQLTNATGLKTGTISTVGGQGHDTMQPYLVVNFCIALQGLFPSRN